MTPMSPPPQWLPWLLGMVFGGTVFGLLGFAVGCAYGRGRWRIERVPQHSQQKAEGE